MPNLAKDRYSVFIDAHQRHYNFGPVRGSVGPHLADELIEIWPRVCLGQNPATTYCRYRALIIFIRGCDAVNCEFPKSDAASFFRHLQKNGLRNVPANLLAAATEAVAAKLRDLEDISLTKTRLRRYRSSRITDLNGVLRLLAKKGILPEIPRQRGVGRDMVFETRRPSLGELGTTGAVEAECTSSSLDDHVETVLALCQVRLSALRSCLEREFVEEWAAFEQGRQWLADEELPSTEEVSNALYGLWRVPNGHALKAAIAERLRHRLGISEETYPPIAVRWLRDEFGGVAYTSKIRRVAATLFLMAGGAHRLTRYLEANLIATNALFGLLLCDTGMNVAPLALLPEQPFISNAMRGKRRIATIAAHKLRAQGKPVHAALADDGEADLPLLSDEGRLSSLLAIERYQEMAAPLRRRALDAGSEAAKYLFLHPKGTSANAGKVISNVSAFAGEHWPAFLKRHADNPVIGGLPITRAMIRPTVLLIRAGRSDFSIEPVQALAEHVRARTTLTYLDADFMRRQQDEQMRSFLNLFEAALVRGIQGSTELTKLSDGELERRYETANDSGLDFYCNLSEQSAGSDRRLGPTCDPLDPCEDCPLTRFIPNDASFLTLHIAHKALAIAETNFANSNPARWFKVWMPWRAVTEAYVRKIEGSHFRSRFIDVRRTAEEKFDRGQLILPIVR